METPVSELQRIGLKFFVEDAGLPGAGSPDAGSLQVSEFIPIFHRWVQTHAVDGLLIDVADYAHVPDGPGVMLIAYEGNYCVDLGDGRMGMLYYRKQAVDGGLPERLISLCRTVLKASRILEEEDALGGRMKFRGDQFQLVANDRLLAPNSDETLSAFEPVLAEFLGRLYGDSDCKIVRDTNPRERFTLTVTAPRPVPIQTLLDRLGG